MTKAELERALTEARASLGPAELRAELHRITAERDRLQEALASVSTRTSIGNMQEDRWFQEAQFESAKGEWERGSRFGIFSALVYAAAFNKPLPAWALAPLRHLWRDLQAGKYSDLNEAFQWDGEHAQKRKAEHRLNTNLIEIWDALVREKAEGKAMDSVTFDFVAASLGVGRRAVQTIWNESKASVEEAARRGLSFDGVRVSVGDIWGPFDKDE